MMHHDRHGRRWRRAMYDDMTCRGVVMQSRRMAHNGGSVVPCVVRGGVMLRHPWRRRLLVGRRPSGSPAAVSAARGGESCSAERDARETCNHEILDVLVHITPLSTFFLCCPAEDHLPLTQS